MSSNFGRRIELVWRQGVVYPSFRSILRNRSVQLPISPSAVKRILIIRNDRLGDMIATTPAIRLLKHAMPDVRIGIMASPANAALIRSNPYVDRIHVVGRGLLKSLRGILEIRRARYDVVLDFIFNRMTEGGLLSNLAAPGSMKFGAGDGRYRPLFNALVPLERYQKHMAFVLLDFVQAVFGIVPGDGDLDMQIDLDPGSVDAVRTFCALCGLSHEGGKGRPFVVLNGSAPEMVRQLSDEQLRHLLHHLASDPERAVIVIAAPTDRDRVARVVAEVGSNFCRMFPEHGSAPLLAVAALIDGAERVITPDTSIVHLASAMHTPVLALYCTMTPVKEWLPYRVPHRVVVAEQGQPVSTIPAAAILAANDALTSDIASARKDP